MTRPCSIDKAWFASPYGRARIPLVTLIVCSLLAWFLPLPVDAADGDLDLGFGTSGKTLTDFSSSESDQANAVAIQSNGKIVVGGQTFAGTADFALARYDSTGALDTATFGGGTGKVVTDCGGNDVINAIAIQPSDGAIVAVGRAGDDWAIARYTANGTPDATFGGTGKVLTDFAGEEDVAFAVAIQSSDNKIVVAGSATSGGTVFFALARYNTDGTLDTAFGPGMTGEVISIAGAASALAIQTNGKIVVGGTSDASDFAVARFNTDGSLDTAGFGSPNGFVTTDFNSGSGDVLNAIAIQPADNKIVAAGTIDGADFGVARYNTNGSLDTAGFGSGTGKITTNFGGAGEAHSVLIQFDGRIVATGFAVDNSIMPTPLIGFALARYTTSGALDTTFGSAATGKIINVLGGTARSFGAALQSDNKIVTVGQFNTPFMDDNDFVVARFQNTAQGTPCVITCPANVTAVSTTPGAPTVVVSYPPPTTTGDCFMGTIGCVPASGSVFPLGTTTVTCTATVGMNVSTCSFTVTTFNVCLQDDSNSNVALVFNATTGDYRFRCGGMTFTGKGTVKRFGSTITLTHNPPDRRVLASVNSLQKKGSASLQSPPGITKCTITDRNTTDNTCAAALP